MCARVCVRACVCDAILLQGTLSRHSQIRANFYKTLLFDGNGALRSLDNDRIIVMPGYSLQYFERQSCDSNDAE